MCNSCRYCYQDIVNITYNYSSDTAYLSSIPGLKEQLIELKNAPDESFIDEEEVVW